jgi:O-antigen/teichoic acid export membrane protein
VTVVVPGPHVGGGLTIQDRLPSRSAALEQAPATDHAVDRAQVKAEGRQAARALHEAMAAAEAEAIVQDGARQPPGAVIGRRYHPQSESAGDGDLPEFDADDKQTLRTKVSEGVRWGVIASIVTQGGRFGFVAVLMRLLGPENFGIVGQASIYIAITYIFLHLGTAATIIQRPQLDKAEVGSAWWINVALGLALAGLTVLAAPFMASFFRTDELRAVLQVLSICCVLKAMAVVPTALLYRRMRFRSLGVVEVSSTLVGGAIAVAAAAAGAGYWALVAQSLAIDVVILAALLLLAGLPELSWSVPAARRLWSFSSRVMGSDLVRFMSENGDNFLVGRFLGATALGFYSLGFRVVQLPIQMLQQAGRVVLPTFSRLQDDRERLAHVFLKATGSVALIAFPAMALTILCAPVAVPALFGEAWTPAVLPLQLLSVVTIQAMIISLTGPVILGVGHADWEFRWSVFSTIVALSAFAIGLNWGIVGVAAAYLAMSLLLSPIKVAIVQRVIPISALGYVRSLVPPFVSSVVMCEAWLLVAYALRSIVGGIPLVACSSVVALAAYLATVSFWWPRDLRYQVQFARQVIGRSGS